MSSIMSCTLIAMYAPAIDFIKRGVSKGASRVVQDVRVMESAKLARAKKAITLEATPLGEQPTRMMPAAIAGSRWVKRASKNPKRGMITNWLPTPISTPLGFFMTSTKSPIPIEVPIPNMMTCMSGMMRADNLREPQAMKYSGKYKAPVTAANIIVVKTYPLKASWRWKPHAKARNADTANTPDKL